MNVYRIECVKTGTGCMGLGAKGLGNFMCQRGLFGPNGDKNEEVKFRYRRIEPGIFFFTEAGWMTIGEEETEEN